MAITDKEKGVWGLDQVYNKINQGSIWNYQVGTMWAWGRNQYGQLGQNQPSNSHLSSPVQIGSDATWAITEFGLSRTAGYTAVVVKSDGTLWSWGDNGEGGSAQNNRTDYSSPVQIPGTTWKLVVNPTNTSGQSVFGIKTDGTLWGWGNNQYGALGQNNTTTISSPIQVGSDTTWKGVASGDNVSGATKTDGTLWMWGRNNSGQLAQNNTTNPGGVSSPIQIPGTSWNHVYSGYGYFYGTKTDGTLWSWGGGTYGSLGQNQATAKYSSPTQIPGTTWQQVSSGNNFSIAIKTDGTMWAWGYNDKGALGVLDSHDAGNNYSSPVQIPGTNWIWASAVPNDSAAFALKSDNTLWSWGHNGPGQLGQNNRTDRSSPTQVPGTWSGVVGQYQGVYAFKNV